MPDEFHLMPDKFHFMPDKFHLMPEPTSSSEWPADFTLLAE
jgi:hypothetical protein